MDEIVSHLCLAIGRVQRLSRPATGRLAVDSSTQQLQLTLNEVTEPRRTDR